MANQTILKIVCASGYQIEANLDSFGKDVVLFGRSERHGGSADAPANDIAMPRSENSISRAHLKFQHCADGWHVINESDFGVSLNGGLIRERCLTDGDELVVSPNGSAYACIIACSIAKETGEPVNPVIGSDGDEGTMHQSRFTRRPGASKLDQPLTVSLMEKACYTIGRAKDCDIRLDHPLVSRRHCTIARSGNNLVLTDEGSTNGVLFNGVMLREPVALSNNDRICIADFKLVFNNGYLTVTQNRDGVSLEAIEVCKEVPAGKGKRTKLISDHVSLRIEPGEFVAIVGGSGCGKSTIMNCLSGMTNYTAGQVLVDGDLLDMSNTAMRSMVGYVPQSDIVYNDLTLEHMLRYSARLRMPPDTSKEDLNAKIEETLKLVGLDAHRSTMIGKLSGGQRKRASMAVELIASPKLFFLDEPFSGLDPGTEKKLMVLLKELSLSGRTVIMVTHSVQSIEMCDRLICMGTGGKLCFSGAPKAALAFFGVENYCDIYDKLENNAQELSKRFRQMAGGTPEAAKVNRSTEKVRRKHESFRQYRTLTRRYTELTWNRHGRFLLLMAMPLILSFFVCVAFGLDGGLGVKLFKLLKIDGLLNRVTFPFLFRNDTESMLMTFACAAYWVGIFNSIQEISKERTIFNREHFTGLRSMPYLLSKITINSALCFIQALMMVAVLGFTSSYTYVTTGQKPGESLQGNTLQINGNEYVAYYYHEQSGTYYYKDSATGIVANVIDREDGTQSTTYYKSNSGEVIDSENGEALMTPGGDPVSLSGKAMPVVVAPSESGGVFNSVWIEMFITCFLSMLSAMALGLVISAAVSNDLALVLCPIALLPQILFSGVTSKLDGASKLFSNIITCRWSVVGFGTTMDLNGDPSTHPWYYNATGAKSLFEKDTLTGVTNLKLVSFPGNSYPYKTDYARDTDLLGMNREVAVWVILTMITLACVGIAFLILWRGSRNAASLSVLNGKRRRKAQ